MRKSGSNGLRRLVLTAIALGALLMLVPAAAQATPPVWDSNFGTATSLSNDDDHTSQGASEDKFTVPFDFFVPEFGSVHKGDLLDISNNGFVEFIPQTEGPTSTGDIGDGCCSGAPDAMNVNDWPIISPFWTDLDAGEGGDVFYREADDNGDGTIDRFIVTWDTGLNDCSDSSLDTDGDGQFSDSGEPLECHVLAQMQVFPDSKIIFGYDAIDLDGEQTKQHVGDDVLVGVSPGCQGSGNPNCRPTPASVDYTAQMPFSSGDQPMVFELFQAGSSTPPPVDLDQRNICYTLNDVGGWNVSGDCAQPAQAQPPAEQPAQPVAPVATDSVRPTASVAGVRTRGCVSRNFSVTVRARDNKGLRQVRVALDGRRIRTTRKTKFRVGIPAKRLRTGSHRIAVTAIDTSGNRRTTTRGFVRCARVAARRAPRFTG